MKLLNCNKIDALQIASKILNFQCYELVYENKRTDVEFLPSKDNAIRLALKEDHRIAKEQFYYDGIGYMKKVIIIDNGEVSHISVEAIEDLAHLIQYIIVLSDDYGLKKPDEDDDEIESLSAHIFNVNREQIAYIDPMG